jgi:3-dehydroquinate synthase
VLDAVGLPTSYAGADLDTLVALMRFDKKTRGDTLRFVVLDAIGRPTILEGPDPGALAAAFRAVAR